MKTFRLPAAALTGLLMSGVPAMAQGQQQQPAQQQQQQQQDKQECAVCAAHAAKGGASAVEEPIADWPETPKKVSRPMVEKYGPPPA